MINIKFKSNINFSNDNEFIPMTTYQVFKIDGRLVKEFLLPLDIIDNWDGQDLTVQQVVWDGYFFDANINESQVKMLALILACKDIIIEDTVNNMSITVDTKSSEYTILEVGEKLSETSNYKANVRFRSNPIYINRKTATDNINYIKINSTFYYNDNAIIENVVDSNFNQFDDNDGLKATTSADYKNTLRFVYYYNATNRNALKTDFEGNAPSNITCYNGTLYSVLENTIIENEEIGKDFYRMVVECVIAADRKYLLT